MHQTNPVAVVEMHGDAWVVYLASTLLCHTVIIPSLLRKVLSLVIGFWQGCLSISRTFEALQN